MSIGNRNIQFKNKKASGENSIIERDGYKLERNNQ